MTPPDVEPGDLRPDGEPADAPPGWDEGPLGTTTDIASAPATGDAHGGRLSRWELLRIARRLLGRRARPHQRRRRTESQADYEARVGNTTPRPWRTSWCQCRLAKNSDGIEAVQVPVMRAGGRAWFTRVQVCGSPWACPVCAARIAQVRRRYLRELEAGAAAQGLAIGLNTLTVPHGAGDNLEQLLEQLGEARRKMRSGRRWQRFRERWGWLGEVRTLEVTYGRNGWHPHYHALHFCKRKPPTAAAAAAFEADLWALWADACRRAGLGEPTREHGVNVQWGSAEAAGGVVADYIAKWGFAGEVTGQQAKWSGKGGRTPWQLLAGAERSRRDRWLWLQYVDAFEGKNQLTTTPGLKARLAPAQLELDNFEAAQPDQEPESDEQPECVGYVPASHWQAVCRGQAHERVLRAAVQGPEALAHELRLIRDAHPPPFH